MRAHGKQSAFSPIIPPRVQLEIFPSCVLSFPSRFQTLLSSFQKLFFFPSLKGLSRVQQVTSNPKQDATFPLTQKNVWAASSKNKTLRMKVRKRLDRLED
jgi:hypothetical protein